MTKENLNQTADKLFETTSHTTLWANPNGEFFTSENLGKLSLKKDQQLSKYTKSAKRASTKVDDKNTSKE